MYKIISNIFKNKMYLSALIITILLLFAIVTFKNTIFIPLFKKDLINNTLVEATNVSKHLTRIINFNDSTNSIDSKVQMIIREFNIQKVHYYSNNGKILYSTDQSKIGTIKADYYFINKIAKGNIYSNIKNNEKLIEVYIPIMNKNTFIGAFEFYYDITYKIVAFEKNVTKVNKYVTTFNILFFTIIIFLLYFISKNNLRDIEYKNKLKNFKNIIDETNAYIFTKDIHGCYTFANKLVLELFQTSLKDLIGKDDSYFFDLEISNELKQNDDYVMQNNKSIEREERNIVKETGITNIYWSVKRPLYDNIGNMIGISGISTDITERKNLEIELQEQKELLNTILNNVDAYVYIKDINRNFLYVNQNTAELFAKPLHDIIGHRDKDVLPDQMADIFWQSDKDVFENNKKISIEETIIDPKGQIKHYWSSKLPYTLNKEKVLIGFSSDITEIYLLKEKLKQEAITDPLTGIYNKRHFNIIAQTEYNRSIRQNLDMSIIMLDIDYFKQINDNYGHFMGDFILQEVSKVFKSQIRDEDTLFRIGGEEFTIILPHTNMDKSILIADKIRVMIENKVFRSSGKEISITVSLGVSTLKKSDKQFEDILLRADKSLYDAKNNGRNKVSYVKSIKEG